MNIVFPAKVEKGSLKLNDSNAFYKYVSTLDGEVDVIVRKKKKNRSDKENRYYHGCVVKILAQELGYLPEEMHEALKMKFLCVSDKPLKVAKSTASLSTVEMEDYLQNIRVWASSELSIMIPLPNQVDY